jgi:hypothetical protein
MFAGARHKEISMKIRTVLFAALVSAACVASTQTFNPERKYVEGDKDAYSMKVKATTQMGEMQITMDMDQIVKKVYPNGDADIDSGIANITVNLGGTEMHPPTKEQNRSTTRFSKFGMPVGETAKTQSGMNFGRFGTYFGDKELKLGETYTLEQTDEKNPKNHSKGTVKLVSLDGGNAKIAISVDNYIDGSPKPMHLDGTATLKASTGKLVKFEGKATDIAGAPGMSVSTASFVMEHK